MNEMILQNPENDQQKIDAMRTALMTAQLEAVAAINADAAEITADNWKAHKLNAFDDRKDYFTKGGKAFVKSIMAACGADKVLVQLTASESAVKVALKEREAIIRGFKDAAEAQAEKFEYICEFCMTDAQWQKLMQAFVKDGVEFRARRVLDNEKAKIGKIFEQHESK